MMMLKSFKQLYNYNCFWKVNALHENKIKTGIQNNFYIILSTLLSVCNKDNLIQ